MTKQDVIDLLRIHATINPKDKEVIEAVIDFIALKFRQDTEEKKFEKNYGTDSQRREALPDGDA
jgi:hypothetical protein